MRISSMTIAISFLGLFLAYPGDPKPDHHLHEHTPPEDESAAVEEAITVMEQLGFTLTVVEDQTIAGRNVTALPISAVFVEQGKTFVIAQDEHNPIVFVRWEVSLGERDKHFVEARGGVFPGDRIVVQHRKLVSIQADEGKSVAPPQVVKQPQVAKQTSIPKAASVPSAKSFGVQVGAFTKEDSAGRLASQLRSRYGRADVLVSSSQGRSIYRVRVGEFSSTRAASAISGELKLAGFPESFVVPF